MSLLQRIYNNIKVWLAFRKHDKDIYYTNRPSNYFTESIDNYQIPTFYE